MAYQLRDYQLKGKQMISRAFSQGHKKIMFWAMTGAGKGFSMSDFNNAAVNARQKVLNVMKRRAIIFQTIENYAKYHGLKASPIMGTVKGQDHDNFCQVASIDTLRTRIKSGAYDFLKQFDLIIIDECFPKNHYVETSKGNKTFGWLYDNRENLPLAKSFNEKSGLFEYKKILNVFKNSKKDKLLELKFGLSKLNLTHNHKLLTLDGYKKAKDIDVGDGVIFSEKTSRTVSLMNNIQKDFFVGSVLGDGGVHKLKNNVFRVRVRHDKKTQGDYCKFKASIFNVKTQENVNAGYSRNIQINFSSISYFIKTDNIFKWSLDNLTPIALGVFAMDDGSIDKRTKTQFTFHTENFNYKENLLIKKCLYEKFGIESKIFKYRKYYILRLNKKGTNRLFDIIKNYIHPSLNYKSPVKTLNNIKPEPDLSFFILPLLDKKEISIKSQNVYDIEVEENHNYVVKKSRSKLGIIAHNCHDLTSKSYKMLIWFLEGYEIEFYSDENFEKCKSNFKKYYIGLTATPFRVGTQAHTFWDVVVKPIEAHELRDMGILVKTREFQPFTIDVKGIRLNRNGEFNQEELFERCTQMGVTGDVVKTYKKYGIINGRHLPAMYFCVNKLHAKIQTQAFSDAGIPARYCNDSHSQKERDRAKADLKSGVIWILLNVDLFSTGFDAPFIELGGFLRPTESENLACQQWGRILRPYKICSYCSTEYGGDPTCFKCGFSELKYEKQFAIMLDHAGNMSRHPGKQMIGNSVVYAIREAELNQRDIDHKVEQIGNKPKECPECDAILFHSAIECEYCGYVYGKDDDEFTVLERDGELVEADAEFLREQLKAKIVARFNGYQTAQFTRRWDNTIKYFKIYDDFGDDIFMLKFKLGITPQYEKVLKQKGEQKRKKELNDNVNKLLENLNYTNKAVVNE